jgi:hypothetical protein
MGAIDSPMGRNRLCCHAPSGCGIIGNYGRGIFDFHRSRRNRGCSDSSGNVVDRPVFTETRFPNRYRVAPKPSLLDNSVEREFLRHDLGNLNHNGYQPISAPTQIPGLRVGKSRQSCGGTRSFAILTKSIIGSVLVFDLLLHRRSGDEILVDDAASETLPSWPMRHLRLRPPRHPRPLPRMRNNPAQKKNRFQVESVPVAPHVHAGLLPNAMHPSPASFTCLLPSAPYTFLV